MIHRLKIGLQSGQVEQSIQVGIGIRERESQIGNCITICEFDILQFPHTIWPCSYTSYYKTTDRNRVQCNFEYRKQMRDKLYGV